MTRIGNVYAQALYDLAQDENLTDELLQQLTVLNESFAQEPAFLRLLSSQNIGKQERCAILDESFCGSIHPYLLNFLKILTEKGYARQFPDCCAAYRNLYQQAHGILPVTAVTAVALSGEQAKKLTEKLSRMTGKHIALENRIDPSVLGGVRLDYDGKQLDDTVAHRLEAVRSLLKNTVL